MEQNIIEGNKLIAEFMGATVSSKDENWLTGVGDFPHDVRVTSLEYNSCWDGWLMPVVEKIRSLSDYYDINMGKHSTFLHINEGSCTQFITSECGGVINATYLACIAFIEWHNHQAAKLNP